MKLWMGAAIALCLASAANAQATHDSRAPVDMAGDESEVITSQCKTIWRGNVEVLQDTSRLRAAQVTVYNKRKSPAQAGANSGCGEVDRMEAEGQVFFVTPTQTVRGDHAVYDYDADTIVVTGDVVALQGKDVARGERMTIKVATNDVRMESGAKSRGKPGRVRAVLYPNEDKKPASAKP
ncbi:MAG: OstA family protein [Caulobacter sp.]|jgi:lipopolysaccharide export system protein LptA|nr:OstA family protein [Caulobacter sp.]